MLRRRIDNNRIDITNTNFTKNMKQVIEDEITKKFVGKLISGFKIVEAKILNTGMAMPSLKKGVIAEVDVALEFTILTLPVYCIIPQCKYIGRIDNPNSERIIHKFSVINDDIPKELLDSVMILVSNNGLSANAIKKLHDAEEGDIIPLLILHSSSNHKDGSIKGQGIPNFDEQYSPVFKFNKTLINSKTISMFSDEPLMPDIPYIIRNKRLVKSPNSKSPYVDFLSNEEMAEYITTLVGL